MGSGNNLSALIDKHVIESELFKSGLIKRPEKIIPLQDRGVDSIPNVLWNIFDLIEYPGP